MLLPCQEFNYLAVWLVRRGYIDLWLINIMFRVCSGNALITLPNIAILLQVAIKTIMGSRNGSTKK